MNQFLQLCHVLYADGLVRKGRSSIANAMELRLSCTNPSIDYITLTPYELKTSNYTDI